MPNEVKGTVFLENHMWDNMANNEQIKEFFSLT
jgi:hypothetical protein